MRSEQDLIDELRSKGHRITVARRSVLRALFRNGSPIAAGGVHDAVAKMGTAPNKTTVYRELEFLEKAGFVRSMQFEERQKRYELTADDHRHHLICTGCKRVEDAVIQDDLSHVEKHLNIQKSFKVQRHSLEFYGLCKECQ